ncbi:hypothetical protein KY334_06705 [Candidatus Woesearchaeota archaeon]|nr:hypothetical protein [Candidatus Woesearchaeota archaeon]
MNDDLESRLEGIKCGSKLDEKTNSIFINYFFEQTNFEDEDLEKYFSKNIERAKTLNKTNIYISFYFKDDSYAPFQNLDKIAEKLNLQILKARDLTDYVKEYDIKGVTLKRFQKLGNRIHFSSSGFGNLNSYRTNDFEEGLYRVVFKYCEK